MTHASAFMLPLHSCGGGGRAMQFLRVSEKAMQFSIGSIGMRLLP